MEPNKPTAEGGLPIPSHIDTTVFVPFSERKIDFIVFEGEPPADHPERARYDVMMAKSAEMETPQWERFRGNNHERIDTKGCSRGGCVSFKHHLGKPLSQQLWIDLVLRLRLTGIRVYGPRDGQWCDSPRSLARVHLDAEGNVTDIDISI